MPQFFVEAPVGIRDDAKQKMMKDLTAAIDDAYHIPDVRVWLREYQADNIARRTGGWVPRRPVRVFSRHPNCSVSTPNERWPKGSSLLSVRHTTASPTPLKTLILMNHYPLENAGFAGRLQSDDPQLVEAMKQLNR